MKSSIEDTLSSTQLSSIQLSSSTQSSSTQSSTMTSTQSTIQSTDLMKLIQQLAKSSVLIITPVTITLILITITVHIQCIENYCPHIPIDELMPIFSKTDSDGDDTNANATNVLRNTGVLLSYIIVATFFLLALIYFRLYKILIIFGIFMIIMLCTMKSLIYWHQLFFSIDFAIDIFTIGLFVWNLVVTGLIIFFLFNSPLLIRQIYLIYICLLVSNFLITLLSPITAWILLIFLIIWDIVAVMTPCGPLNLMLKLIKRRQKMNEKIYMPPILIYSTIIFFDSTFTIINEKNLLTNQNQHNQHNEYRPNLGLGDFVFYSLLMGQVRQTFTLITIIFTGLTILIGLIITLLILVWKRKPLPALPISLILSIIIVICSGYFIEPFSFYLNSNLIFI